MGIPYYFSYLIKNHNLIISKLQFLNNNIANLFLDCNSLIYDSLDFKKFQAKDQFESYIIETVIIKIGEIIKAINPLDTVYIAFDGVAPIAKLEQQRSRRFKSLYQNSLSRSIYKNNEPDPWNTTAITPGTNFMKSLDEEILKVFKAMSEDDGIIVKKDGNNVHLSDDDANVEYLVKLGESEEDDINESDMKYEEQDESVDDVIDAIFSNGSMSDVDSSDVDMEDDEDVMYEITLDDEDMDDEEDNDPHAWQYEDDETDLDDMEHKQRSDHHNMHHFDDDDF